MVKAALCGCAAQAVFGWEMLFGHQSCLAGASLAASANRHRRINQRRVSTMAVILAMRKTT